MGKEGTKLNVGQVVRLKSGGPEMTVTNVCWSTITCTWFDDRRTLQAANFQRDVLEAVIKPQEEAK